MRPIDADNLKSVVCKNCELQEAGLCAEYGSVAGCLAEEIDNAPIVDAVPVVHGHWVEINLPIKTEYECSVCHKKDSKSTAIRGHYCWYCGAKMDEAKKGEMTGYDLQRI